MKEKAVLSICAIVNSSIFLKYGSQFQTKDKLHLGFTPGIQV